MMKVGAALFFAAALGCILGVLLPRGGAQDAISSIAYGCAWGGLFAVVIDIAGLTKRRPPKCSRPGSFRR